MAAAASSRPELSGRVRSRYCKSGPQPAHEPYSLDRHKQRLSSYTHEQLDSRLGPGQITWGIAPQIRSVTTTINNLASKPSLPVDSSGVRLVLRQARPFHQHRHRATQEKKRGRASTLITHRSLSILTPRCRPSHRRSMPHQVRIEYPGAIYHPPSPRLLRDKCHEPGQSTAGNPRSSGSISWQSWKAKSANTTSGKCARR